MSQEKRTLVDRLRELEDLLGQLLSPKQNQPLPRPVPVRQDGRRVPKR